MPPSERNPTRPIAVNLAAILAVAGVVALGFYLFRPQPPNDIHWLAMSDTILACILVGAAVLRNNMVNRKELDSTIPPAMHSSIVVTVALILIAGVIISLAFAALASSGHAYPLLFRWILAAKWVLAFVLAVAMWTAGREGAATMPVRVESRRQRQVMLDDLLKSQNRFRSVSPAPETRIEWNATLDEIDALCNQLRGWISAFPEAAEANAKAVSLLSDLRQSVDALVAASPEQRQLALARVKSVVRDTSFEIRSSSTASSSGVI